MENSLWYSKELRDRLVAVKNKIRNAEIEVNSMKTSSDEFMEKYNTLNLLRIEKKTIESRINNMGNARPVTEPYKIPNINN